jgi:hypothetical protein
MVDDGRGNLLLRAALLVDLKCFQKMARFSRAQAPSSSVGVKNTCSTRAVVNRRNCG